MRHLTDVSAELVKDVLVYSSSRSPHEARGLFGRHRNLLA